MGSLIKYTKGSLVKEQGSLPIGTPRQGAQLGQPQSGDDATIPATPEHVSYDTGKLTWVAIQPRLTT